MRPSRRLPRPVAALGWVYLSQLMLKVERMMFLDLLDELNRVAINVPVGNHLTSNSDRGKLKNVWQSTRIESARYDSARIIFPKFRVLFAKGIFYRQNSYILASAIGCTGACAT